VKKDRHNLLFPSHVTSIWSAQRGWKLVLSSYGIPISDGFGSISAAALPIPFPKEVRILGIMYSHDRYIMVHIGTMPMIFPTPPIWSHHILLFLDGPTGPYGRPREGSCASSSSSEASASAANCLDVAGTNKKTSSVAQDMRRKAAAARYSQNQWIGLTENLQENRDFPMKYGGFLYICFPLRESIDKRLNINNTVNIYIKIGSYAYLYRSIGTV